MIPPLQRPHSRTAPLGGGAGITRSTQGGGGGLLQVTRGGSGAERGYQSTSEPSQPSQPEGWQKHRPSLLASSIPSRPQRVADRSSRGRKQADIGREEGGGGGSGSGTQKFVYEKWPHQISPFVKFILPPRRVHGGGSGLPNWTDLGLIQAGLGACPGCRTNPQLARPWHRTALRTAPALPSKASVLQSRQCSGSCGGAPWTGTRGYIHMCSYAFNIRRPMTGGPRAHTSPSPPKA